MVSGEWSKRWHPICSAVARSPKRPKVARLAAGRIVAAQGHAGAGSARHQTLALIDNVALHQSYGLAGAHHPGLGAQFRLPHRTEKIDLEFQSREGLACGQSA